MVIAHSFYCLLLLKQFAFFFLLHLSELSEHGIWNKALSIHPLREGAFFFFSPNTIALNNRVTFIHGGFKLLFFNSANDF